MFFFSFIDAANQCVEYLRSYYLSHQSSHYLCPPKSDLLVLSLHLGKNVLFLTVLFHCKFVTCLHLQKVTLCYEPLLLLFPQYCPHLMLYISTTCAPLWVWRNICLLVHNKNLAGLALQITVIPVMRMDAVLFRYCYDKFLHVLPGSQLLTNLTPVATIMDSPAPTSPLAHLQASMKRNASPASGTYVSLPP